MRRELQLNCLSPKAILFDFDGTLVDTMGGFADIAARVINSNYGVDLPRARRMYLDTSGLPFFEQLELLFPGNSLNGVSAGQFEEMKLDGFFNERLSNEVKETLTYLRGKGIFLAVSSNNLQELVEKFLKRENAVYFDEILGAKDNFFKGRDHFNYIKERYFLNAHEILFVGDSLKDAEKALSCGVNFVAKLGTFSYGDFRKFYPDVMTINSISDLKGIVL